MTDRETRTILLVDGSSTALYYRAMLLKRLEYKVVTARSAEDALRQMEASNLTIVLVGLSLPGLDSLQFLRRIRENPRSRDVPVIIVASDLESKTRDEFERMGCSAFLASPVEPSILFRTLQTLSEESPRSYIRLRTSLKVVVGDGTVTGGASRTEYAAAISEGGLYVRTLYPQPRNVVVPLRLFVNEHEVSAKAVVLYTYALGEGPFEEPGMGMKFVWLSDDDRAFISVFIRQQLTGDITPQDEGKRYDRVLPADRERQVIELPDAG